MIVQAMSMIRSKNIFVCFCVNSIFDLDPMSSTYGVKLSDTKITLQFGNKLFKTNILEINEEYMVINLDGAVKRKRICQSIII